jgi:hypothetical protein
MSACLFTINQESLKKLNFSEIIKLRDKALKILGSEPNKDNKFECDQWCGNWDTLTHIVRELDRREEERFNG